MASDTTALLNDISHRRYNPLRGSWVLVSPHRTKRPWQGQQEPPQLASRSKYDDKCYLCPGNSRASGQSNPKYETTYIFQNDFAAVKPHQPPYPPPGHVEKDDVQSRLMKAEGVTGNCFVVCFSPRHDLTLADMGTEEIIHVVDAWKNVYQRALDDPAIVYCQIFENKGSAMGCSNPHPHGQVWMTSIIPEEPRFERESFLAYREKYGSSILSDYYGLEKTNSPRLLYENTTFIALVPYWGIWPFEALAFPKRFVSRITDLTKQESYDLADIVRGITVRFDNLFECSFPYSMGIHQAPTTTDKSHLEPVEHLHLHFYPPLLRSATVKKFLVGFELLGMPQRDITPEQAASRLREKDSTIHYKKGTV